MCTSKPLEPLTHKGWNSLIHSFTHATGSCGPLSPICLPQGTCQVAIKRLSEFWRKVYFYVATGGDIGRTVMIVWVTLF
jgi:hypothetical protein